MGCNSSKTDEATRQPEPQADNRREKQAEKRRRSQDKLRPEDEIKQEQLQETFKTEVNAWPHRPSWFLKGKHTQGINLLIASPEPLREMYFTIVARNEPKYTIQIGYGKETKFDVYSMRFSIMCSTVSMNHAKIHFSRENGKSTVSIEDCNSLNGTFVLGRPQPASTRRPMLEMEVRDKIKSLEGVEYIRLGSACVLVLDSTNIYWDDEEDDDEEEEKEPEPTEDLVNDMLTTGWYFPMPCPPKLAEITMKKRDVVEEEFAGPRTGKAVI